jgi:DNA ligase-1
VLLADLVATSAAVASTRARNAKIERLAALLRQLAPDERAVGAAWLSGELPQKKIGVGWAMVREAAATTPLADAAPLTVAEVDATLSAIAAAAGAGSGRQRKELLGRLFARATEAERAFVGNLVIGELRQGALAGILVDAIAKAAGLPAVDVRRAFMVAGDLGTVASAALGDGAAGLAGFAITVFRPLLPMLAQTAEDVEDALAQLGTASFDVKLDGARVQIHRDGDDVRVFSRGLNDVTVAVPEVVAAARALPVRRLILDGEAIALRRGDPSPTGLCRPHPFQVTMRRFGRSGDDAALRASLPLDVFLFDALLLDDQILLDRPAHERWAALDGLAPTGQRVPRLVTDDPARARAFYEQVLADGHEGVMAKAIDAPYDAGSRGAAWLKLKKVHTLDLVVLAAEWGSGRRKGFLSNLHLGARDPAGGFVMLGKTFKGMTDEILTWQTGALLEREAGRDGHAVHVRPELVVEIAFNDVQASPHYPGGLALRFARLVRYRPDKRAADADTIDAVRAIAIRDGVIEVGAEPR